ncbi:conserved hypothetical protein [Tenacibaculum sp. 190524A02b]|uniref:Uncharacterized protein n=1 Tax=Tenacibaculum vairaonense TaxID=3137860 RepID=A0ABP1F8E1_9FLAO
MRIVIYSLILFICISCLGSKKVVENTTSKTLEKKTAKKEVSNTLTKKSEAIDDHITVAVPKVTSNDSDFNSKCTKELDQLLKKLNTQKSSGNNNYKLYYDLEKRLIELKVQIAETQSQSVSTLVDNQKESAYSEVSSEYIFKKLKVIPWYLWIVIYFFFLDSKITSILSNLFPRLKGATSILSLIKTK